MDNIFVSVPKSIENLQLPDPELLTYYHNLENRVLWLETEVDSQTLDLVKRIIQWNEEDKALNIESRKPIKIFFFSPGGDLEVNNALIDTIRMSKTPVWGINVGRAYSAAAFILLSCHKRFVFPRAQLLLHQGSGAFEGTYAELVPQIMAYQAQIEKLGEFVSERTKYTQEDVESNIAQDWYIDANEGLEKGVYDALVEDMSIFFE